MTFMNFTSKTWKK